MPMMMASLGLGVLDAGGQIWAAGKASDAEEKAAKRAQQMEFESMRRMLPFYQQGRQSTDELGALFGFEPTGMERKSLIKGIKGDMREQLKSMPRSERNAFVTEELRKKLEARQQRPDYGFLSKRFGAEEFQKDPGYEFRMGEGEEGIKNYLSSTGMGLSGPALKAIERYRQGFASNEYGNAYNRYASDQENIYNRLMGLKGQGMNASQAMGGYGSNIGEWGTQGANAKAAGYIGKANAFSDLIGNVSKAGGSFWSPK